MAKAVYEKWNSNHAQYINKRFVYEAETTIESENGRAVYVGFDFDINSGFIPRGSLVYYTQNGVTNKYLSVTPTETIQFTAAYPIGGDTWGYRYKVNWRCDIQPATKTTYIGNVIADYGSLPADGRHTDGYWYVFVKMASDLKGNISGAWRDMPTGFTNVNGIWKPQNELKANVNGVFR